LIVSPCVDYCNKVNPDQSHCHMPSCCERLDAGQVQVLNAPQKGKYKVIRPCALQLMLGLKYCDHFAALARCKFKVCCGTLARLHDSPKPLHSEFTSCLVSQKSSNFQGSAAAFRTRDDPALKHAPCHVCGFLSQGVRMQQHVKCVSCCLLRLG